MAHHGPGIFTEVLEHCADGVCLVDPRDWRIEYANRKFRECARMEEGANETLFGCLPQLAEHLQELEQISQGMVNAATLTIGPACEIHVHGVQDRIAIYLRPSVHAAGRRIDPLTGLSDRTFFLERLETLLHGDRAGDSSFAVLFIDIDGFKQINDAHGHLVGDRVLGEVARRLAGCLRAEDLVARFGGDEFVALLDSVHGPEEVAPVAERIRAAFGAPIAHSGGAVTLAVSVGGAVAGPQHDTAEALIAAADRAMYAAKRAAS